MKKKTNPVAMYVKDTGAMAETVRTLTESFGTDTDVKTGGWAREDGYSDLFVPVGDSRILMSGKKRTRAEKEWESYQGFYEWVKMLDGTILPDLGQSYGYDLQEGDWVEPHGKGKVGDFLIRVDRTEDTSREKAQALRMTLKFSNEGDGIMSCPLEILPDGLKKYPVGSVMWSPLVAPKEGYEPEMTLDAPRPYEIMDHYYLFRVRTQMKDGKVMSTQYGKISPWLTFYEAKPGQIRINLKYYLNVKPNEESLEWDVKQNPLKSHYYYPLTGSPGLDNIDNEG
ncbi:MAG: hypothetical protein LBV12_03925 [Puniceicoccales bacterium]|nr:hypothetical protein [Puniceicoccales bacterium]